MFAARLCAERRRVKLKKDSRRRRNVTSCRPEFSLIQSRHSARLWGKSAHCYRLFGQRLIINGTHDRAKRGVPEPSLAPTIILQPDRASDNDI
jgi:hypothetical protein